MSANEPASRRDLWDQLVHRSLRVQLRIFLVIFAITLVVTIERVVTGHVNVFWAAGGFVAGIVIGAILARSKPLAWDATAQQVVASNTVIATVLLVLYIVFAIEKGEILDAWLHNARIVGVTGMAITCGVMWGRLRATFHGIRGVLGSADLPLGSSGDDADM